MSVLKYKTRVGERPQGKPYVYFSCHPDDFGRFFGEFTDEILKMQDCTVWYESEPDGDYDREDLELYLSQMQLFVIPVTTRLLTGPNRAMDFELGIAQNRHIPVLPLMMEKELDDMFSERFGDLQYLDPYDTDETRRSFEEVLEAYLRSVLVSSELADKVRAAFDAYIFLSYRKKDRKKAQELMRMIHREPVCRDVAIWYDEFLTPGEDFNRSIEEMLEKSDIFALAVTPNLVNESNYVMTTEYPAALKNNKPVVPVEMAVTDRAKLEECYADLPPCISAENEAEVHEALIRQLKKIAVTENDRDPEHNFLIGLAYLDGIDVEVDPAKALGLISGAAAAGVPEAMKQLVTMYETGKGTARDYYKGVKWREKYVRELRRAYEENASEENAFALLREMGLLGEAYYALRLLDDSEAVHEEAVSLSGKLAGSGEKRYLRLLSASLLSLGKIADARGDLARAREYYEKSLALSEEMAGETGTAQAYRLLTIGLARLGDIARAGGDLQAADSYYKKALFASQDLIQKTGKIEDSLFRVSVSIRIGQTAETGGDPASARVIYEMAMQDSAELAGQTGSADTRRALASCCMRIGNIERKEGDLQAAQDCYEKALALREELAGETGTIKDRRELSDTLVKLGGLAQYRGDALPARDFYERALKLKGELAEDTISVRSYRVLARVSLMTAALNIKYSISRSRAKELLDRVVAMGEAFDDDIIREQAGKAQVLLEQYL